MRRRTSTLALVVGMAAAAFSSPMISVDSPDFDFGPIREGKMESAVHVFKVKNTGDSVLVIKDARPGWGCTVVGFDSIIPPGREGSITESVNLKSIHGGDFQKFVTVTSNAKNTPSLRLSIKGSVKAILGTSTSYIRMGKAMDSATVVLNTEKTDLKINKVYFKVDGDPKASWQADLPIYVDYKVTRSDSAKAGYYDYTVKLSCKVKVDAAKNGNFVLETNHPDKSEITIRGRIDNE